ncbi:hypothetical protein K9M06_05600 [Candidatus Bipolaricaulota bacterium]|nr:hypothetical protein [Candidatus Bipolaricaulota bacterium]
MSNTKLIITVILSLALGFAGGYIGQMIGGGSDSDLSDRVDAVSSKVNDLESQVSKMPSDFSSFATVGAVDELKTSIGDLQDKVQESGETANTDLSGLRKQVQDLESQVKNIDVPESSGGGTDLKVGYVNATNAFNVFTNAVKEERESAQAKQQELVNLREKAIQGEISEEEFQKQSDILQAEQLKAQLEIDLAMVEKMMNSKGFESIADLKQLKQQVEPIITELNNTLSNMRQGSATPEEVSQTLSQINSQYQQLDDLLTRVIETKIFQITNVQAQDKGYDLVFRQENVILYRNGDRIDDLTDATKEALRNELSS